MEKRIKQKIGRALAIAGVLAIVPGAARAEEPLACTTSSALPDAIGAGNWTITADEPQVYDCAAGECTTLTYAVQPNAGATPDHVVIEVGADVEILVPDERFVSPPCVSDTATGKGGACHTQAVRLNSSANNAAFELTVLGRAVLIPSTVYVKKGKLDEACRIASLGTGTSPVDAFEAVAEETVLSFKTCRVSIPRDRFDGTPGIATFAPGSDPACAFVANGEPLESLGIQINGVPVGLTRFSTDFQAGSGDDSCSTQVIRGRIYTFCTCQDVNGDGIADDPRPPCQ